MHPGKPSNLTLSDTIFWATQVVSTPGNSIIDGYCLGNIVLYIS